MFLSLNTNLNALIMQRSLNDSTLKLDDAMQKLSCGVRINSASDDAANFVLSKDLDSRSSGLSVANNNIKTSLGTLYTLDGYLKGMTDSLHRTRDLAVQANNGVYSTAERNALNQNAQEMQTEINTAQSNANSETIVASSSSGASGGSSGSFISEVTQIDEAQAITDGYDENHIIRTAADFQTKINADKGGDFILVNDLDMSELGTLNDSVITSYFFGNIDGNGHIVSNLTIDTEGSSTDDIGLFTGTNGVEIKNLGLENATITAVNSDWVGILAAHCITTNTINCYSTGTITAANYAGGLAAGHGSSSHMQNCYSSSNVNSNGRDAGGLVGANDFSIIQNCYATGNVSGGTNYTGGLVGDNCGNRIHG